MARARKTVEDKTPLIFRNNNKICRCSMCMTRKNLLTEVESKRYEQGLKATIVDRRNPDQPAKPLMKAVAAYSIITAGTFVDLLTATGLKKADLPSAYDFELTEPQELRLRATWKNKNQEQAQSGQDASVFGSLGVLVIPKEIEIVSIPKMNALSVPKSFLEKYGAQLIPLTQAVEIEEALHPSLKTLYLIEYQFDKDYIPHYVMHQAGGGGLFVETHPFPQIFTPLSKHCSGALILGIDQGEGNFDFAAFEIPFGFTLKINSNVIHGDSFFVGPYAIALTETNLADSVLLKRGTTKREIQVVEQDSVQPVKLPLLAEHRLERMHHHQFIIDRIRQKRSLDNQARFFNQRSNDALIEMKEHSNQTQEIYDKHFGLVPYRKKK